MPKSAATPTLTPTSSPTTLAVPRTSRLDLLVTLLGRPSGATIAEMTEATGWQAHSVRGAMAGALKKRGHSILSTKVDGLRTYWITTA